MNELINGTTGGLKSQDLLQQQNSLLFQNFSIDYVNAASEFFSRLSLDFKLPMAAELRFDDWVVFHQSFPGSSPENDDWISRKARVVKLTGNSSLYERVKSEEEKYNWFEKNSVSEKEFAIHGGGFPIKNSDGKLLGSIMVSGLPQIEDHKVAVKTLEYLMGNFE